MIDKAQVHLLGTQMKQLGDALMEMIGKSEHDNPIVIIGALATIAGVYAAATDDPEIAEKSINDIVRAMISGEAYNQT